MEVVAIGAELDMVLRADRVLQLWAAAEPGKVIDGVDGEAGDSARSGRHYTSDDRGIYEGSTEG